MWQQKIEGARVRSRIQDYEEGEKSSKFFFRQEKINTRNKLWHRIKGSDGQVKFGIDNILNEQRIFYQKLMKSEGWDKKKAKMLTQNIDLFISAEDREMCDKEISYEELEKAVKYLKNNRDNNKEFAGI